MTPRTNINRRINQVLCKNDTFTLWPLHDLNALLDVMVRVLHTFWFYLFFIYN